MMTSKTLRTFALGLFALASIPGCGTGIEPLSALNDPNTIPQLTIPFTTSQVTLGSITPYSTQAGSTNDGFSFIIQSLGSTAIFAPAPGIVTHTDGNAVTIYHNARFTTRISQINVGTTPGTVVTTATIIGTGPITGTTLAHLQVILDGAVVCPYFFLVGGDAAQRTYLNSLFGGGIYPNPCL